MFIRLMIAGFIAIGLVSAIKPSTLMAQVPDSLSFQGHLTDSTGALIDTSVAMTFKLYKGSAKVWEQTLASVVVTDGYFSVLLGGSGTASLDTVAFNRPMDVGITIGTESEMTPRTPLASGAYALGVRGLYSFDAELGTSSAPNLIGGASNNTVNPGVLGGTIGGGGGISSGSAIGNVVSSSWGTVGGGAKNVAWASATVAGGFDNQSSGSYSVIGGGSSNISSSSFATISGGISNEAGAASHSSTIGGGNSNVTSQAEFGVVAGGLADTASAYGAVVSGGTHNRADGSGSVVSGGVANKALGVNSAIGGGVANTTSGTGSTIPGGTRNRARGQDSFSAGYRAHASHDGSFVWNDHTGYTNTDADTFSSTASNQFLIRADGGVGIGTNAPQGNVHISSGASGNAILVIEADSGNTTETDNPMIQLRQDGGIIGVNMGFDDLNFGGNKFGIGRRTLDGDFWDTFVIDGTGYIGMGTNTPLYPLQVGTTTGAGNGNGAHVTTGGAWTDASSKTFKTNVIDIDRYDILRKLANLPISSWEYTNADDGLHIGPMAEEFYDAFGLGNDDRYISGSDARGVSMAAIQALFELVQTQQNIIEEQGERLEELEDRLAD